MEFEVLSWPANRLVAELSLPAVEADADVRSSRRAAAVPTSGQLDARVALCAFPPGFAPYVYLSCLSSELWIAGGVLVLAKHFCTAWSQCVVSYLDRSACLICLCCWLYFVVSQLLTAESGSHWLDLNTISHTQQNYWLANFPGNENFFQIWGRHPSSTHSGCLSGLVGKRVTRLMVKRS